MIKIPIEDLKIHPKNVRKEYEGIEELADSIREKGVIQNLTVVPDPDEDGKYLVVIGNRRLMAARAAGVEAVPCVIGSMIERDQIATMLCENMNRKDLKIYEEAAAMQMCIEDYGFTVPEVAKKTGLSKTTVNHRLNIARLDQDVLKKKADDSDFQLTLHDLSFLERVKNQKTRNRILKEATSSGDLARKAQWEAKEEKRKEHLKVFIRLARNRKIKGLPDDEKYNFYSHWDQIAEWDLDKPAPSRLNIKNPDERELFYMERYGSFLIVTKKIKQKAVFSEAEKAKKDLDKKKKEIKAKYRVLMDDIGDFLRFQIKEKPNPGATADEIEILWRLMIDNSCPPSYSYVAEVLLDKDIYSVDSEEREKAIDQAKRLPMVYQMISCVFNRAKNMDTLADWEGKYLKSNGEFFAAFKDYLADYYFYEYPNDDLRQIVDGTHELYTRGEKEDEV